jgi:DNA-binding transcriptional ArsR family regulator
VLVDTTIRDNDDMPRVVRPLLAQQVEESIEAFGNRVRVAVLRSLELDGRATRGELAERLQVTSSILQKHLATLEEMGLVYLDPPRSEPERRPRWYIVDRKQVAALINALSTGLQPPATQ